MRVGLSTCLPLSAVSASVPARRTEHGRRLVKAAKQPLGSRRRPDRHVKLLPELWRGRYRATHFAPSDREAGGHMNDYEQVTLDIREGLSIVAANKGEKSVEIIMKEILEVLTTACEQHNIDKFDFIQAFYEWFKEKRN
jgi:hypothetical protein